MADKTNTPATLPEAVPAPQSDAIEPVSSFKGYSLADIRYYRALTTLQREFCKQKIVADMHRIQKINPLTGGTPSKRNQSGFGAMAGKILSGLSYMDYILLGFRSFSTIRRVFSLFRRKK